MAANSPNRRSRRTSQASLANANAIPEEPPQLAEQPQNVGQAQPAEQVQDEANLPSSADDPQSTLTAEQRMDMDFMYFMALAKNRFDKLPAVRDRELSQLWLQKLCGDIAETVDAKRNRNIYLSHLVLDMDTTRLSAPFNKYPPKCLSKAEIIFGLQHSKVEPLTDIFDDDDENANNLNYLSKDGRTYLASRMLPDDGGVFAFVAISSGKEPIKGAGQKVHTYQEEAIFDDETLFTTGLPVPSQKSESANDSGEDEQAREVLGKRRSPEERDELIKFYDNLLVTISEEMEGITRPTHQITPLIQQMLAKLEQDILVSEEGDYLANMQPVEKTTYLLEVLQQRLLNRRNNLMKRGGRLDEIEKAYESENAATAEVEPDPVCLKAIERAPSEQSIHWLMGFYPPELIERFVILLRQWCHETLRHIQPRYDCVLAALKRDLEAEKKCFTEEYTKAENAWRETQEVLHKLEESKQEAEKVHNLSVHKTKHHSLKAQEDETSKLQAEFKTLQMRFDNELKRHALLREQINTEHEHMRDTLQRSAECLKRLLLDEEALLLEIENLEEETHLQKRYIRQLYCQSQET